MFRSDPPAGARSLTLALTTVRGHLSPVPQPRVRRQNQPQHEDHGRRRREAQDAPRPLAALPEEQDQVPREEGRAGDDVADCLAAAAAAAAPAPAARGRGQEEGGRGDGRGPRGWWRGRPVCLQ